MTSTKNTYSTIEAEIYNFKTKYKNGFIDSEIELLLAKYGNIDKSKFNKVLGTYTGMEENNEIIIYRRYVFNALSKIVFSRH